ncbi:haloacid dehalogenase [Thalassotalea litorea]|uniref:Haloacid dehalogenase n=1 Tax=Thalassotalea litorea TaxID=2020715 RepID=A0A5R9IN40_9GAMM|nr:HAD-IA family hydrolase [Thalassotalea litorea]TLU64656.1 haloacid dehalogenase [Thalassotalea litorea]
MRFYRRLQPFKALSFDLDDTLYDNHPVITRAERALREHLQTLVPKTQQLANDFWWQQRNDCLQKEPHLSHDVTALRLAALTLGLAKLGFSKKEAQQKAQHAFAFFLRHRNNLQVAKPVIEVLEQLAQKFPIVAISNGNVSVDDIGIRHCFKQTYFAGNGNLQKPQSDMFMQACDYLDIAPQQLLHVGDCTHADIFGAMRSGCQTAWVHNESFAITKKPLQVLPTMHLDHVEQLRYFI